MKKKTYVYILVPLLALAGFIAIYWNFEAGYEKKQEAVAAAVKKAREDRVMEENRMRLKVVQTAIEDQERRKREKEERDAKTKQQNEELEAARQVRNKAEAEVPKLRDRVNTLTTDIGLVKEQTAKIEADKKSLESEVAFLHSYVKLAQDNTKKLTAVLDKIAAADAAAAAAAAAAARAAAAAKK